MPPEDQPQPQQNFELIKRPDATLVVNSNYPDKQKVSTLLQIASHGIPSNWKPLPVYSQDPDFVQNVFMDDPNNPEFVMKVRKKFGEKQLQVERAWVPELDSRDSPVHKALHIQVANANQSLLNEFALSAQVKSIIGSKEAEAIAQRYGFRRMNFVEPIMGIMESFKEGRKAVFYDYIDGDTYQSPFRSNGVNKIRELSYQEQVVLSDEIATMLYGHGIFPPDMAPNQLISSVDPANGNFVLNLIDIESFLADPEHKFSQIQL